MAANALTPEQQSLVVKHLNEAKVKARWYTRKWPYLADEIESAAMYGLVYAASRWTPETDQHFLYQTRKSITTRIIHVFDKANFEARRRVGNVVPDYTRADHRFKSPEYYFELKDQLARVHQFMLALRPRQQDVIRLIHEDGLSQSEAARSLGVTRERARQLYDSAIGTLKKMASETPGDQNND